MNEAEKIEEQVQRLPPEDLARFRAWFFEFDAQVWDRKIESDMQLGKLSTLLAEARSEFESGKSREKSPQVLLDVCREKGIELDSWH